MASNITNEDKFINALVSLMKIRAEQQPEKVKQLQRKYAEAEKNMKKLSREEVNNRILDILDTLGMVAPAEGESVNE